MPGITRNGLNVLGADTVRGMFYDSLDKAESAQWIGAMSHLVDDSDDAEEYLTLNHPPTLSLSQGATPVSRAKAQTQIVINDEYNLAVGIPNRIMRRNKTELLDQYLNEAAADSAAHWARLLTSLVEQGETLTTVDDGQAFFAQTHSAGGYTGMKNYLTASEYAALNVGTANNPTPSEFAAILLVLIQHFRTFKADNGEPRNDNAMHFHCMVPTSMMGAAVSAINAELLNAGSGSADNIIGKGVFRIDLSTNSRLSDQTEFYLARADGMNRAFIRQQEYDVKPYWLGLGSEHSIKEGECLLKAETSRAVGYSRWHTIIKAQLS